MVFGVNPLFLGGLQIHLHKKYKWTIFFDVYDYFEFCQVPHLSNSSLPPLEQATAQHIDNYFRQELIYRRNDRMGQRVLQILRSNPDQSFFFAFGAGKSQDWELFFFHKNPWKLGVNRFILILFLSMCNRQI